MPVAWPRMVFCLGLRHSMMCPVYEAGSSRKDSTAFCPRINIYTEIVWTSDKTCKRSWAPRAGKADHFLSPLKRSSRYSVGLITPSPGKPPCSRGRSAVSAADTLVCRPVPAREPAGDVERQWSKLGPGEEATHPRTV